MAPKLGAIIIALSIALAAVVSQGTIAESQQRDAAPLSCRVGDGLKRVTGLPEASGVAVSRAHPGVLWSHNDSGAADLIAIGTDGIVKGHVRVAVPKLDDWEDTAVGPCGQGSCLYLADIGDNNASRQRVTVYRIPEPGVGDKTTGGAEAFHATYPDGPHDAEGIVVTSADDIFVVTKDAPGALYRFPKPLRPDSVVQLQRVAAFDGDLAKERITGAAASPDGRWVVVRTNRNLVFYQAPAFVKGQLREGLRFDVSALKEPQGEGIAIGADGSVYLAGEGSARAGTLGVVRCTLGS